MVLWIEMVRESELPIILKQHHLPRIPSCAIPPIQFLQSPLHSFSLAGLKFRSFMMKLGEPGYGTLKEMQDALKALDECLSRIRIFTLICIFPGGFNQPPRRLTPKIDGLVSPDWCLLAPFSLPWGASSIPWAAPRCTDIS